MALSEIAFKKRMTKEKKKRQTIKTRRIWIESKMREGGVH